jgi:hypothetical protein
MQQAKIVSDYEVYKDFLASYGFKLTTLLDHTEEYSYFNVKYLERYSTWTCNFRTLDELSAFTTGVLQYHRVKEIK